MPNSETSNIIATLFAAAESAESLAAIYEKDAAFFSAARCRRQAEKYHRAASFLQETPMNYDPNLTCCGNMAQQTVELTFQSWEYTTTKTVVVGGNCTGLAVIDFAINKVEEELGYDEGVLELTDDAGNVLESELWENPLEEMLVGARIISICPAPDEANTVSAIPNPDIDLLNP